MNISSQKLAKALFSSLKDGVDPEKLAKNFEKYLSSNHLLGLTPKVVENLEKELEAEEWKSGAHISVSHEVSKDTVRVIEKFIGKSEKDKTILNIDPSLVGGFRSVYRGKLYDGSIKNYLKELRAALVK